MVNEKMTALADEIRKLSGTTDKLGIDTMTSNLAKVNALSEGSTAAGEDVTEEINAYTTKVALLETAITALETELIGKASGGSGVTGLSSSQVTLQVAEFGDNNPVGPSSGVGEIYYSSPGGNFVSETINLQSIDIQSMTITVATNTILVTDATDMPSACSVVGGQRLTQLGPYCCVITEPTATITLA